MIQALRSNAVLAIDPDRLAEAEFLLGLYPAIPDEEIQQIVSFLRKGPILDRALLEENMSLSDKIARFKQDHRSALRIQRADYVALAIVVAIIVAIVALNYSL